MEQLAPFFTTLLNEILGYDIHNPQTKFRDSQYRFEPEIAHLFRAAKQIDGFRGAYFFKTSPDKQVQLPERPAVCFAEAASVKEAREIHRKIWNLGLSPFLIVLLPNQVRVYTARDFDAKRDEPLIEQPLDMHILHSALANFSAISIDSGRIWKSEIAQKLDSRRKVDSRLLRNLSRLAQILVKEHHLSTEAAHALIGKYVYIRYLTDRRILSREWLANKNIDKRMILGRQATKRELQKLSQILEERFNGDIFPIPFDTISDEQVKVVAAVFEGDEPISAELIQTGLDFEDFKVYNFEYIPTETLSFIYELFLKAENRNSQIGAYYTPEWLADYILSEVQAFKPLQRGMKLLDPACGSGIFLVLAYQRLIEHELRNQSRDRLPPEELRGILTESIYGVEIEKEACKVTELSLILTLLNYVEPPELHKNEEFKFPRLSNTNVFHSDFFNDKSLFWKSDLSFDWIVGNPPWRTLGEADKQTNPHVFKWIAENKSERPVGDMRIEEAFSWRAADKLTDDGIVGIVHHATSLFNLKSAKYRQVFFRQHEVLRITNLANFRQFLFKSVQVPIAEDRSSAGATAPAATVIYKLSSADRDKQPIVHYGPFIDNQIQNTDNDLWSITINESEITTVSPEEAELGEFQTWKFALWGTTRDKQAVDYLKRRFPMNLSHFCISKGWLTPFQGPELKSREEMIRQKAEWKRVPEFIGKPRLDTRYLYKYPLFSIPEEALQQRVTENDSYLRRGQTAIHLSYAPHIYLAATWNHIVYSDDDFIIPPRQIGIATGRQATNEDKIYMRALAAYLRSSLTTYYIFFNAPEWGTFLAAKLVVVKEVRNIPIPEITFYRANLLSQLYESLARREKEAISNLSYSEKLRFELQEELDNRVAEILEIPEKLLMLAREFVMTRLLMDGSVKNRQQVSKAPSEKQLHDYAALIRDELDGFADGKRRHLVTIMYTLTFTECLVEIKDASGALPAIVQQAVGDGLSSFAKLQQSLRQQHSQSVYVQRSLRVFDGPRVYIYKPSRLIDWTKTQALNDATDLIREALEAQGEVVT